MSITVLMTTINKNLLVKAFWPPDRPVEYGMEQEKGHVMDVVTAIPEKRPCLLRLHASIALTSLKVNIILVKVTNKAELES